MKIRHWFCQNNRCEILTKKCYLTNKNRLENEMDMSKLNQKVDFPKERKIILGSDMYTYVEKRIKKKIIIYGRFSKCTIPNGIWVYIAKRNPSIQDFIPNV
ncbi:hypothetical protein BpHYR1_033927 [Brachionus plicatilis]|uniref:Uncharacterized protein n=1 Tax=Brachionus plicatilis TaxID=10195 RepID=A0A3M7SDS6_BRAPC|nr:hypothetical protein BpHYR1_033927 [Brachionus plicatilis]